MSRPRFDIRDGAARAVVSAYPDGASAREIGAALGVSHEAVRLWERDAVLAFIIAAGRLGLDARGLLASVASAREVADGADPNDAWNAHRRAAYAAESEAIEIESMRPSDTTRRLYAELDRATWKARRAALVLGEIAERAREIDAAGSEAA
jgi:hypothetical protein